MNSKARSALATIAWLTWGATLLGVVSLLQKSDDAKQKIEEALHAAQSRAEAVEYITQAMVICAVKDDEQGRIIVSHFQPSARRFFNIEREQIEGHGLEELMAEGDREMCAMAFRDMIEGLKSGRLSVWNTSFFRFTGLRRGNPPVEFPILMSVTMREPTSQGEFQFSVVVYSETNIAKVGLFESK